MRTLESSLLANLEVFVAFARNRLGDPHMAEDVVQESLVKALAAERRPKHEEETTAWFYRILRRSIGTAPVGAMLAPAIRADVPRALAAASPEICNPLAPFWSPQAGPTCYAKS